MCALLFMLIVGSILILVQYAHYAVEHALVDPICSVRLDLFEVVCKFNDLLSFLLSLR